MTKDTDDRTVTAEQVLKFLADNPDFLAGLGQPVPSGETDSKIIDLTPAIAKKARNEARKIGQQKKIDYQPCRRKHGQLEAPASRSAGLAGRTGCQPAVSRDC
jgi:hypothetical protein